MLLKVVRGAVRVRLYGCLPFVARFHPCWRFAPFSLRHQHSLLPAHASSGAAGFGLLARYGLRSSGAISVGPGVFQNREQITQSARPANLRTHLPPLPRAVLAERAQSPSSALLSSAAVSQGQQGQEPGALVGEKPKLLQRAGERDTRSAMAQGESGLRPATGQRHKEVADPRLLASRCRRRSPSHWTQDGGTTPTVTRHPASVTRFQQA